MDNSFHRPPSDHIYKCHKNVVVQHVLEECKTKLCDMRNASSFSSGTSANSKVNANVVMRLILRTKNINWKDGAGNEEYKKEVIIQGKERSKLKNINNEIKEINQTVLDDLTVSNEKMSHIIPGSL